MQEIAEKIDKVIAMTPPYWAAIIFGLSSIAGTVFTGLNTLMLFQFVRRAKNKRALQYLLRTLNDHYDDLQRAKNGNRPLPNDKMERVIHVMDKIYEQKPLLGWKKVKQYIDEIKEMDYSKPASLEDVIVTLELLKNELEEVL